MSIFEDREKAAERKFEQEQELSFRVVARRNRLLGLWAAARIGLVGDAAERYAVDLVQQEVTEHGDRAVVERIHADLVTAGAPASIEEIGVQLRHFAARARAQLTAEAGRQE